MTARPLPRSLSVELRLQLTGLDVRTQFRVLPGRTCALVGHEAAGLSEVLQAAAGLIPARGGRIALGNEVIYDSAAKVNWPAHKRHLAWLSAQSPLLPHLSVKGNLTYRHRDASRTPRTDVHDLARWLDIAHVLDHRPTQLTHAQRFRVALGRALLSAPHALLLDDPLAALPAAERAPLLSLLAEVPRRCQLPTVLVSTRMDEVIAMADDMVIIHEGRTASAGAVPQILSDVSFGTFLDGEQAGSVLEGEVKRHDIDWLLSEIDVCGQRVTVPATLFPLGSKVRLKLRARDLSLHKEMPADTSSSNHLRGIVTQVMLAGEHGSYGAVVVALDHALEFSGDSSPPPVHLWAMLTRKAIQQMGWAPGHPCVVGFKAMATQVTGWH